MIRPIPPRRTRSVPDLQRALNGDVKGLRIGVPKEYFISGMQPEVEQAVRDAIRRAGETWRDRLKRSRLPHTEYAVAVYYIVATAEASSNLARYDGMRFGHRAEAKDLTETYMISRDEGFGAEVKRRIMLGTYALSAGYYDAYYLKAQRVRTLIKKDFDEAFKRCDVDRHADRADDGVQDRREDPRPAANVSVGYLHDLGQSGRLAGALAALRL